MYIPLLAALLTLDVMKTFCYRLIRILLENIKGSEQKYFLMRSKLIMQEHTLVINSISVAQRNIYQKNKDVYEMHLYLSS